MVYRIYPQALSTDFCMGVIQHGEDFLQSFSKNRQDRQYPTRGYPGGTLPKDTYTLPMLASFAADFSPTTFDFGYGTGVNFVNAQVGESIGVHEDTPLFDETKDERALLTRLCQTTVIASLNTGYTGGTLLVDGEELILTAGDILVFPHATTHGLAPVTSGVAYFACGFFCADKE